MFSYQKRLLYPIHVEHPDEKYAEILLEHYWGKNSELTAYIRYMRHHWHISNPYIRTLIGFIAAEELGHLEMIGVAIKKLGVHEPAKAYLPGKTEEIDYVQDSLEILQLLKIEEEAEGQTKNLYLKHLSMTKDMYLKKMIRFLIDREELHQRLIKKTADFVAQEAGNEQFAALIHEYKMSLRVIK